ncbi:MAG: iron ABC transporter permease [Lacrimispora sp.]|uniref:FecCD family ABC transporter permease n=1 Tax=Lacrimispora sp. TaxID=2719234 RepID=UPI0039E63558
MKTDQQKTGKRAHPGRNFLFMGIILVFAVLLACVTGQYYLSVEDILKTVYDALAGKPAADETAYTVLFHVRLPRILAALLVGAGLSTAGASYQGVFKNPMASPDLLGASAGASLGAAAAILMNFNFAGIHMMSFGMGIMAVALTFFVASAISYGGNQVLTLVLTGMVVGALFQAFVSITKYVADPYSKLPVITFWLMGGFASIGFKSLLFMLLPLLFGVIPLMFLRHRINILSFGEEEAYTLGVDARQIRLIIILCSTLITSSCVAVAGVVGWVGLIIPHLSRLLMGPNYKVLLPASALIGSIFLVLVDTIIRGMFIVELPIGILTSIMGAPFFILLLLKGKRDALK